MPLPHEIAQYTEICKFTVLGNQEKPKGNPIPYFRQTQKSAYKNPGARRYHLWCDYVRASFLDQCPGMALENGSIKPLTTDSDFPMALLYVMIFYKDKNHGDPDNIYKGIADALFDNDKYLNGQFWLYEDRYQPRIEVILFNVEY